MALIRERDSKKLHIKSKLMGESLVSKSFLQSLEEKEPFKVYPNATVLKLGGQSITDYGSKALTPVLKEIVANAQEHKMLISTGGGTRSRHVYAIAMDMGLPTGIIAKLGQSVSEQNALMISTLLGPYNGIKISQDDIPKLGLYFSQGCIPVIHGMPPYGYFEQLPAKGLLPPNRTDVGAYLLSEVLGTKQCIFVKDEDGLYTDNPKVNSDVKFIPKVGVQELLEMDLDDLIIERGVLEMMKNARNVKQIQIINGLKEGNITKALNGEHVGTIIFKD
ncbi:Molybdenum storage protein subunit beta [Sporomusa ovata DSM 2662]|nr:molybdenum storage protein subunit beta [Sporomusa ovata]EQB25128.1 molybdenum storage protein subunit beta [Sporomusa ovata DSM 2662]